MGFQRLASSSKAAGKTSSVSRQWWLGTELDFSRFASAGRQCFGDRLKQANGNTSRRFSRDVVTDYRLSTVRCSMYRSNSLTEYITILSIRVNGGPEVGFLLLQLLSVQALTPRIAAASLSRTYRLSPIPRDFGSVLSRATTLPAILSMSSSSCNPEKAGCCPPKRACPARS